MTEVMNYYGRSLRITDVLQAEEAAQAITPALGLLEESGIARTVERFGFHATIDHAHTLVQVIGICTSHRHLSVQVIGIANKGTPVVVSIPPKRTEMFSGGHVLVVTGGNASDVYLADSSSYDLHALSRSQFVLLWSGLTAIITPQGQASAEGGAYA
jgi:hypothetical protein